ncbi:Uncharacterised protein [Vibrio cholerae]|uniref:Uncharacterized protein n=1 Tax=Vibrio cholerae TaxID=666 RepID=A0A655X2J9_VIBCL|nr:Uncharacterised protein [Vibrio cholerae]
MQLPFGFEHQPSATNIHIGGGHTECTQHRKSISFRRRFKSDDIAANHIALGKRGQQRADFKAQIPMIFVVGFGFCPKIKRDSTHDERD